MAELKVFLRSAIRVAHVYGRSDCLLFPSDWWLELTGVDPAAGLRGTYSDQEGAEAILASNGGIEALSASAMAASGGVAVDRPLAGDVGLVRAHDPSGAPVTVGGVFTGFRWAARGARGLFFGLNVESVRVWRWSDEWRS